MIGFGIDLAGYTTGKTAIAAIEAKGHVGEAILLRQSHLSLPRSSTCEAATAVREDVECLRRCLRLGHVAVDVPICLQGLPYPSNPSEIWGLTRRPIDQKLRAMPPLADRIGAPVARFAAIMRLGNFKGDLGESLFETYPAATWKRLNIKAGNYKSKDGKEARAALCGQLKIRPPIENDDDIDAVICAATAAAPDENICTKDDLALDIGELPRGFRLLKARPFESIYVTCANFDEWLAVCEKCK